MGNLILVIVTFLATTLFFSVLSRRKSKDPKQQKKEPFMEWFSKNYVLILNGISRFADVVVVLLFNILRSFGELVALVFFMVAELERIMAGISIFEVAPLVVLLASAGLIIGNIVLETYLATIMFEYLKETGKEVETKKSEFSIVGILFRLIDVHLLNRHRVKLTSPNRFSIYRVETPVSGSRKYDRLRVVQITLGVVIILIAFFGSIWPMIDGTEYGKMPWHKLIIHLVANSEGEIFFKTLSAFVFTVTAVVVQRAFSEQLSFRALDVQSRLEDQREALIMAEKEKDVYTIEEATVISSKFEDFIGRLDKGDRVRINDDGYSYRPVITGQWSKPIKTQTAFLNNLEKAAKKYENAFSVDEISDNKYDPDELENFL